MQPGLGAQPQALVNVLTARVDPDHQHAVFVRSAESTIGVQFNDLGTDRNGHVQAHTHLLLQGLFQEMSRIACLSNSYKCLPQIPSRSGGTHSKIPILRQNTSAYSV